MKAELRLLSEDERTQVHERSLKLLATTGVRVLSGNARRILKNAGAMLDEGSQLVRFPRALVDEALRLVPRKFRLGSRRPGGDLEINAGKCYLLADGGALSVLDWATGNLRPGTFDDWLTATHLIDAIDEIGVYWNMIQKEAVTGNTTGDYVSYWRNQLKNCSKHIQDSTDSVQKSQLLMEILQIAFGGKKAIRQNHPFSYLVCPMSPLVIDKPFTDAYLETAGYDIPVAIRPMPLMGASGPASLISTLLIGNSEMLAMLCLVQAAAPGTPVFYGPIPQAVEPHTWRYTGGAVENSLFGAAVTEMGRYYGLPVEVSTGGTDQYFPGVQASYERAINWSLPTLSWPDILVGPGLLGGSTIFCLEQLVIDVEIFRRCTRLHSGFDAGPEQWFEDSIRDVLHGGNFLNQRSTLKAIKEGGWYLSKIGFHNTYEEWRAAGMPDVVDQIQDIVHAILKDYQPVPLDIQADRELEHLERKLRESEN